jgi:hypothetical protein
MISLHKWAAVFVGAVGCAGGLGVLAIGCGSGDDHGGGPVVEGDATTDAMGDAAKADGATPDVVAKDGGDAGNAADASDAALDGATSDAGDAGDGSVTTVDGSVTDASITDAGPDVSPALLAFPGQVAQALCGKYQACCAGSDAGSFDMAGCVASQTQQGYSSTLLGVSSFVSTGVFVFDSTKAQACLNDIASIDCSANLLTTAAQTALLNDCTEAVVGTIAAGASCQLSVQCSQNQFCNVPSDGGLLGVCAPLVGDGGTCSIGPVSGTPAIPNYGLSQEPCSFRRSGNTNLRCQNAGLVSGNPNPLPWTCGPTVSPTATPPNNDCNFNQDCTTQLCNADNNFVCATSELFADPKTCQSFAIKDAGGGG